MVESARSSAFPRIRGHWSHVSDSSESFRMLDADLSNASRRFMLDVPDLALNLLVHRVGPALASHVGRIATARINIQRQIFS